jgi:hypothetical protein
MKSLSFHRLSGLVPKSRTRLFTLVAAFAVIAVYAALPAFAVHDVGVFELDGNATNSPAGGADDWDNVYPSDTTAASGGATATSFKNDGGRSATIFTGGGSKDDLNINPPPGPGSGWAWKNGGGLPDKDNLLDSFAARYTCDTSATIPCVPSDGVSDGDTLLYFGADRFDNSGDAQIGFWFLQGDVSNLAGGTFGPDSHQIGDVLILSDFTGGGGTTHIRIFMWDPTDATAINGTLVPLGGSATVSADCQTIGFDDPFCATVNAGPTPSPWPFTNKSGDTSFAQGEFYEGGINLSAFPELEGECFASFLSETRSSQSVDATLKDFVVDSFEACEASIKTTPSSSTIALGQSITDSATVTGEGGGTPTGTVDFHVCTAAQLNASGQCETGGTQVGSPVTLTPDASDPNKANATSASFTPTSPGHYCFRGDYIPAPGSLYSASSDFATTECFDVTDTSTTSTKQNWLPNDSATVTSTGGSALAGSVAFTLYDNGTCSGTVLYGPENVAVSGASPQTVSTNNQTVKITVANSTSFPRTVSWKAVYTSSNSTSGSSSTCETTTISISD